MHQINTSILLVVVTAIHLVASTDQPAGHGETSSRSLESSALFASNEQARDINDPLDASASDQSSTLTTRSHKILVSGWPATSPMWPSIQMADKQVDQSSTHWYDMIEPFIYADKPRSNDYSLLLTINKTISSTLRNHSRPIEIDLSFEYYFSYDQKTTAPPGMRIEVDRKQLRYLEPDGQLIRPNLWNKLNEKLQITELARLDNPDWLKISLVNRQMPSLVALRRLRVEFLLDSSIRSHDVQTSSAPMINKQGDFVSNPTNNLAPSQGQAQSNTASQQPPIQPQNSGTAPQPIAPPQPVPAQPPVPPAYVEPQAPLQPIEQPPPFTPNQPQDFNNRPGGNQQQAEQTQYDRPAPAGLPAQEEDGGLNRFPPAQSQPQAVEYDNVPASSNDVGSKVKPGEENKKSRWSIWGKGRQKRDTDIRNKTTTIESIILTCFQADDCHWKTESSEQIQWSLARMPPSTKAVQLGYYYVSNRNNYGDLSRMLNVWLNRTDSATIADQNSDHCIDFAFYVTDGSRLNLFQLKRGGARTEDEQWTKGSRLLTWSPTMATPDPHNKSISSRNSVPKSNLVAMDDERNGWTLETLCFGDFFNDATNDCAGLCGFGFEMTSETVPRQQNFNSQLSESNYVDLKPEQASEVSTNSDHQSKYDEQVVGVAILQEYTTNVPLKRRKLTWLETWQRDQVVPSDNWKFYPRLDYGIANDNVTLMNMFDKAHYYIQSDWLNVDQHLNFTATLAIEPVASNETLARLPDIYQQSFNSLNTLTQTDNQEQSDDIYVFGLGLTMNLVDGNFNQIYTNSTTHHWSLRNNETQLLDLSLPVTESIQEARDGHLQRELDSSLYKLILELVFDAHWLKPNSTLEKILVDNDLAYRLTLANVTLSDRCFPNPCQHGLCQQNGTGLEDWTCLCDEQHRGRRCEFGRWCSLPHILPWNPNNKNGNTLKISQQIQQQRQPRLDTQIANRITGKEYCQRKLGAGSKCTDIDLPLNDFTYTEEDRTFYCSCQDDYYLSDDSKCKSAHLCNSVVCPSIGMICDESRPFNKTQPCHCDEKQDWFTDSATEGGGNRCVRRQCQDKQRDCQFNAHICLPTLPGEKPICKCGPKFTLKVDEKGQKYCQSTACVLPTLNDCQQVCVPDNSNLLKPYTCACHLGYLLEPDGRTCRPQRPQLLPHCRPACHSDTQICTDAGCKCKQGFVGEGEVRVQVVPKNKQISNTTIDYTQSIKCLNVCSLTYAENKEEFERIESVCPLGLCDPSNFQCRCSDPSSSALINTKYEPISGNSTDLRSSPLCHLKRVCEPESSGYKICRSRGAICVPDYTKPAMFDCICPPSTEKRRYGQETVSEFTCEPKCSTKKSECLRRQAVCKLVDRDEVRCECLPGLMFDQHDQKCYLAKYSYSFNIVVVNRYYEPEARFHKLEPLNATSVSSSDRTHLFEVNNHPEHSPNSQIPVDRPHINEILPQFINHDQDSQISTNQQPVSYRSIFITEYNQCNITQVIPKSVIDDPYEHDIESYLGYMDQCNEKIHQNVRTYQLNSKLSEDLRQSLRQHLRDFTVTTNNSSCLELEPDGMYLNCTVYLQSNEPIQMSTVDFVFNDCDKHGQDDRYCWIKPRLLLKKKVQTEADITSSTVQPGSTMNFRQIIPCEINNFCGLDAYSVRIDDKTSQCSCKCPLDIETIDVKDLEPKNENEATRISIKEICAPRNHCGNNSTFCLGKIGSSCQYDIRTGSRCTCVYPSYENAEGQCVEITFSTLDSTLIVIIIMLGTGLIVSIAINLAMVAKSKSVFGRSKQYPLNEFSSTRPTNRSTGVPNPVFTND